MSYDVFSEPPHDCREGFPSPPDQPVGTIVKCTRPTLKGGLLSPCGRQWIVWPGRRRWFSDDDPPYWKEETYDW